MYFTLTLGDTVTPKLSGHHWSVDTVASAFEEAGFTGMRRIRPELSELGRARYGSEYWENFLRCPPSIFLEGRKR
jgi:toxoflavin synthase